jgi:hypothetical protein
MKWISPLFSDARNKIGGTIYARNRAGVYQRARVTPSNPQTAFQQANREMFSTIVKAWRALTGGQRLAWNNAAESATLTDSLGQTSMPSGFQLYVSRNRNLMLCGAAPITSPLPNKGVFDSNFGSDEPVIQTDGALLSEDQFVLGQETFGQFYVLIKQTNQLSPGISFVAPFLYRTLFTDDAADSSWDITAQWVTQYGADATDGNRIGTKILYIDQQSGEQRYEQTFLTAIVSS